MTTTKREIVKTLVECGATHAFTLPGLGITWMLDDFYEQRDKLKLVLSRSEQHASIMAQAYGKVTGKPAVLMGMGPFLTTTGARVEDLRAQAAEPEFLAQVLDFVLLQDEWVLEFAEAASITPEQVVAARAVLGGGDMRHWT